MHRDTGGLQLELDAGHVPDGVAHGRDERLAPARRLGVRLLVVELGAVAADEHDALGQVRHGGEVAQGAA